MTRPPARLPLRDAVLLGAVQGLAEFLPISSSAHLVLARRLLGVKHPRALDIALHLGSTAALLVVMRHDLAALLRGTSRRGHRRDDAGPFVPPGTLLLATLPAVVAGAPLHGRLDGWEDRPARIAAALIGGSIALVGAAKRSATETSRLSDRVDVGTALVTGLAQAVALLPGVSRSGATISVAMIAGLDCAAAARLSFLLAVPITLAANVRALREVHALARGVGAFPLLAGGVAAAVAGLAGASLLRRWLSPRGLLLVALYRGALATALVLLPARDSASPPTAPCRSQPSRR